MALQRGAVQVYLLVLCTDCRHGRGRNISIQVLFLTLFYARNVNNVPFYNNTVHVMAPYSKISVQCRLVLYRWEKNIRLYSSSPVTKHCIGFIYVL